ncbi:MAG TPA: VWA domain-containing protein, partial [Terracidiphilus sp.]|nr:VWA domain-containing protein [Terracidiphilus sp.]
AERLARLSKAMAGANSLSALRTLADESAFQPPPADEMPRAATPTVAEQRRILALTVDYVRSVLPLLPNLLATRTTEHFEDMPQTSVDMAQTIRYRPLHPVGLSSVSVVYRDGKEVVDDGRKHSAKDLPQDGSLSTQGIFGPFLGQVLVDAARSQLSWQRWENSSDGVQAVFRFTVPLAQSHYEVSYCCVPHAAVTLKAELQPYKKIVGYHGEMAVDPTSGIIRRLVVEADLEHGAPVTRSDIIVEYGPVQIGGRSYTCPVRSISEVVGQIFQTDAKYGYALANQQQPLRTLLNDAAFKDYHVFRAETHVLTGDLPPETASATTPASSAETPPAEPANSVATEPAAAVATATAAPPTESPAAPPAPEPAEMSWETPTTPTDAAGATATAANAFTIRTTTRLVDVPVVAFDKKGRPITDLKPEDFVLLDNGRKQKISFFSQASGEAPSAPVASALPDANTAPDLAVFSNHELTVSTRVVRGAIVLMIDASNLAFSDLGWAREQMLKFLRALDANEPVGLYVLRSYGFQILLGPTVDHAAVAARLGKWMPTAQDLARAQDEERLNRQQINEVHSVSDLERVNGHTTIQDPDGTKDSAVDPQLRDYGRTPGKDALSLLITVARHLAAIQGHKSLVWVASDNVFADWAGRSQAIDKNSKTLATSSLRAQEALNEAHVSLYPLDASQLEVGGVDASIQHRNVELTPAARDAASLPGASSPRTSSTGEDISTGRDMRPGRVTAQMQQDLHAIAPEYQDLAISTGGRALRRAGDIATELNGIVNDGRAVYQLSFTPDTPADGQYHRIAVEWAGKGRGTLRYRAGYLYRKEAETMKDRLHDAIWEPGDAREIGLTASVVSQNGARKLHLTIAAADLALSEQADRWMDKLDLITVMRDDAALEARTEGVTLALRLKPASYQSSLKDGLSVDLPAPKATESGTVRAIVIDRDSGRMGSVTIPSASFADSAVK